MLSSTSSRSALCMASFLLLATVQAAPSQYRANLTNTTITSNTTNTSNTTTTPDPSARIDNLLGFDPALNRVIRKEEKAPDTYIVDASQLNASITTLPGFRPAPANTNSYYGCMNSSENVSSEDGPSSHLRKRFINPPDDRYLNTDDIYPFNLVGKLEWSNGVFCSGALIGPRHALTAKHCWVNDDSVTATFSPGFNGSTSEEYSSATVVAGFMPPDEWGTPCGFKGDWVVLILDERLGQRHGYFGVRQANNSAEVQEQDIFTHVGYPGDLDRGTRPYRVDGNPIYADPPGRTQFDCDEFGPFYIPIALVDSLEGRFGKWMVMMLLFGAHYLSLVSTMVPHGQVGVQGMRCWGPLILP